MSANMSPSELRSAYTPGELAKRLHAAWAELASLRRFGGSLTRSDWKTINAALALYEANADDDVLRGRESEAAFERRVGAVREKVHDVIAALRCP